jgi:hypothetical protein
VDPDFPKNVGGAARVQHRALKVRGDTRSHSAVRNPTPRAIVGMSEFLLSRQRRVKGGVDIRKRPTQSRREVQDPFGGRKRLDGSEFKSKRNGSVREILKLCSEKRGLAVGEYREAQVRTHPKFALVIVSVDCFQ